MIAVVGIVVVGAAFWAAFLYWTRYADPAGNEIVRLVVTYIVFVAWPLFLIWVYLLGGKRRERPRDGPRPGHDGNG